MKEHSRVRQACRFARAIKDWRISLGFSLGFFSVFISRATNARKWLDSSRHRFLPLLLADIYREDMSARNIENVSRNNDIEANGLCWVYVVRVALVLIIFALATPPRASYACMGRARDEAMAIRLGGAAPSSRVLIFLAEQDIQYTIQRTMAISLHRHYPRSMLEAHIQALHIAIRHACTLLAIRRKRIDAPTLALPHVYANWKVVDVFVIKFRVYLVRNRTNFRRYGVDLVFFASARARNEPASQPASIHRGKRNPKRITLFVILPRVSHYSDFRHVNYI